MPSDDFNSIHKEDDPNQEMINPCHSIQKLSTGFRALIYLRRHTRKITQLLNSFSFENPDLQAMYQYAVSGGQRSRPLLVLLACEAVGGHARTALPMAAAIELAHKASCIHDDLVDGDDYRRGRITLAKHYGPEKALAVGDLLISLAFEMLEMLSVPAELALQCSHLFTQTFRIMATGQLKDLIYSKGHTPNLEDSMQMLCEKTAVMGELALRIGGLLGGGQANDVEALALYGKKMGLAFQLMNDLNNFWGSELTVGRVPNTDLLARKKTPMICYALEEATSSKRLRLNNLLTMNGDTNPEVVTEIRNLILETGAPHYIDQHINTLLTEANEHLSGLPGSLPKDILKLLTDRVFISKIYF